MKIKTSSGKIRTVSLQKTKQGVITLFSEEATGIFDAKKLEKAIADGSVGGIKGRLVLATKYQLDLLKKVNPSDISIGDDFMPTDVYESLDHAMKSRFWMDRDASITIDPATNGHLVSGKGPFEFRDLLLKQNAKSS